MTSMPLTFNRTFAALLMAAAPLRLAIVGSATSELLLGHVLVRRRLHHRLEDRAVGFHEVGDETPLRTVPGLDADLGRALVIRARRGHRRQHAREAQRVEPLLVQR